MSIWGLLEVGDLALLPHEDNVFGHIIDVGLSSFLKFATLDTHLVKEVVRVDPSVHTENVGDVLFLYSIEDGLDKLVRHRKFLGPHHTFEYFINFGLILIVDDTGAIDQENALGHRDILPHFGLTGDGSHLAASLLHQSIDDRRFTNVRVADKPDRNRLFVSVQNVELLQQLDQTSLTEWVSGGSLERDTRVFLLQVANPLLGDRSRHKIAFIQNEHEVFRSAILLDVFLKSVNTRAHGVTSVKGKNDDI